LIPMKATDMPAQVSATSAWEDTLLVQECLKGSEEAWSALVDKYKNLIYSIPLKYGLSRDEAADIFQSVFVEVLGQLGSLREPRALSKWLMQITAHKTYRWKHIQARSVPLGIDEEPPNSEPLPPKAELLLIEAQQEQLLREAISALPSRCALLVKMLFFDQPPIPYAEIAKRLGIATGSIGFVRGRCLKRLRKQLEELGRT
jgi:RNA polymerase sigma factor (sigma-70 family)